MNNFGKKTVLDDMREYLRKWNITEDALAQKVADTTIDVIEKACKDKKEPIRVFLSLPMSGKTDDEILGDIAKMKAFIKKECPFGDEKVETVDNFGYNPPVEWLKNPISPSLLYLGQAIKRMATCNVAFFHPKYDTARGCLIELEVCKQYGIPAYKIVEVDGKFTTTPAYTWVGYITKTKR